MKRTLMAALIGGALVYFFDPENGQKRRDQAMDWFANLMEQSPDKLQGIRQATTDQWQGLSSNVSQRMNQFRSGTTSGTNSGTSGYTGTSGMSGMSGTSGTNTQY